MGLFGNLFSGSDVSVVPEISRPTFFPGNVVTGKITVRVSNPVEIYGVRVHIIGEVFQRWRSRSGKHSTTHTRSTVLLRLAVNVLGFDDNKQTAIKLDKGDHQLPFGILLPPNALPSFFLQKESSDLTNAVRYYVSAEVSIKGSWNKDSKIPFQVLSVLPGQMWQMPSQITKQQEWPISWCCCISKGRVSGTISLSKSVFALDRDSISIEATIDNTLGEDDITSVELELVCVANCSGAVGSSRNQTVERSVFKKFFNLNAPRGQSGSVTGTMQLAPNAPATFSSSAISVSYSARVSICYDGCFTENPRLVTPVHVAHTVDLSGMFNIPQQYNVAEVNAVSAQPNFVTFQNYQDQQQQQQQQGGGKVDPLLAQMNYANQEQSQQMQQANQAATAYPPAFFSVAPEQGAFEGMAIDQNAYQSHFSMQQAGMYQPQPQQQEPVMGVPPQGYGATTSASASGGGSVFPVEQQQQQQQQNASDQSPLV